MPSLKKTYHHIIILLGMLFANNANAVLPIQKIDLPSGAKLFYVEAKTIPMVNIGIDFPGGSAYDPSNKVGVADLTADLMNKGAKIKGKDKDESYIADSISDLGSMISFNASNETSSVRIKTLSKPEILNAVVSQASDMLAYPLFPQKILEREKALEISGLKESLTKPENIVGKQFKKLIYRDNPLGHEETIDSIKKINSEDLKKFHQMYYRASYMNVLIVGDVSRDKAIEIGTLLTQNLPTGQKLDMELPPLQPLPIADESQRVVKINHPSAQAHIQVGMTSPPRRDPDYFPLLVGNYALGGGGFVSRLMNEIREKRGLAYSVSSYFYPAKNSGYFLAGMQTRKDQSNESVQLLRDTIARFIEDGPSDEEVNAAKNNLINGYPLRLDSNSKLLENISAIAWLGLPLDTLDQWTHQVKNVTKDDIQKAFKKNLDMQRMVTVVVGGQ